MAASVGTLHQEMGFSSVVIARFDTQAHFPGFDPEAELPVALDPRPAIFLHLTYLGYRVFVDFGEVNRRLSIVFFGKGQDDRRQLQRLLRDELNDSAFFEPATPASIAEWRAGEARIWDGFVGAYPVSMKVAVEGALVAVRQRLTLRARGLRSGAPVGAREAETRGKVAAAKFRSALSATKALPPLSPATLPAPASEAPFLRPAEAPPSGVNRSSLTPSAAPRPIVGKEGPK